MRAIDLDRPFTLGEHTAVAKMRFEESEMFPVTKVMFGCFSDGGVVEMEIEPYKTGKGLVDLYSEEGPLIDRQTLIDSRVAESSRRRGPEAPLEVNGFPAIYYAGVCGEEEVPFLMVFGVGESQPGRMQLVISGIWRLVFSDQ